MSTEIRVAEQTFLDDTRGTFNVQNRILIRRDIVIGN